MFFFCLFGLRYVMISDKFREKIPVKSRNSGVHKHANEQTKERKKHTMQSNRQRKNEWILHHFKILCTLFQASITSSFSFKVSIKPSLAFRHEEGCKEEGCRKARLGVWVHQHRSLCILPTPWLFYIRHVFCIVLIKGVLSYRQS